MDEDRRSQVSLNALLAAVEAAPPVAAVDVLAAALAEAIGAREVSFLIADFSGRSLIRLGHSGGSGGAALAGEGDRGAGAVGWDAARPGAGRPGGRGGREDGGARLFAPVTSRGEAVGVLELGLEDLPD